MKYFVTDYLDRTAKAYKNKVAVVDTKRKITYEELYDVALSIATYLLERGISFESVPIYALKSVEMTCALWGIAYAGSYYTFLDVKHPEERIKGIVKKLTPKIILTDDENYCEAKRIFKQYEIVCVENILDYNRNEEMIQKMREKRDCLNPLYVNFTSGTTGEPKGVVVGHLSVVDFIDNFVKTFNITEADIVGNQAPFDFDVSVKDIYSCAAMGATLVLIPREYFCNPKRIMDYLCEEHVTTIIWAVSAMCFISTMKGFFYKVPTEINKVMFSGEVLPNKHLKIWRQFLPEAMYVNLYGPTEITCNCTYHILDKNVNYEEGIPIGRAFLNERVYLLDKENRVILNKDEEGEIAVSGITLALGYYKDEENTEKSFINNPNNSLYAEKLYLTGDLAKYDATGELYYVGRKDTQIKYLGHRIELGEIEAQANDLRNVDRACCVFHEKKKIILFYVGELPEVELKNILKEKLPEYMVPSVCVRKKELPMTKNGKLDRKRMLRELELWGRK